MKILHKALFACTAFLAPCLAQAAPLTVVNVSAPAINCVFNPTCTVTVTDSVGNYPPATGYTGVPRLQSRTYPGQPGTPGAGLMAYVYRVDFTAAHGASDINCATNLKVDFGPVARLPYGKAGPVDVFVVTSGGLGTIGVASAVETGSVITFTFSQPVCPAGGANSPAQTSFFFGLASKTAPKPSTAKSDLTFGGGEVSLSARAPLP